MKRLEVAVDTLRCEAAEGQIRDDLLAEQGVAEVRVDLTDERIEVAYDEAVLNENLLLTRLRFFGLDPVADPAAAAP